MIAPPGASGAARPNLPLTSLLAGAVALAAAATALVVDPLTLAGPAATPASLALLHAVTVGYVALLFAGTLQQLLPVLLVTRLGLPWLGSVALPLLALGAIGVVAGFALGFQPLALAAGGALASAALWAVAVQAVTTYARA